LVQRGNTLWQCMAYMLAKFFRVSQSSCAIHLNLHMCNPSEPTLPP